MGVLVFLGGLSFFVALSPTPPPLFVPKTEKPIPLPFFLKKTNAQIQLATLYESTLSKNDKTFLDRLDNLLIFYPNILKNREVSSAHFWQFAFFKTIRLGRFDLSDRILPMIFPKKETFYLLYQALRAIQDDNKETTCPLFTALSKQKRNLVGILGKTLTCYPKDQQAQKWKTTRQRIDLETLPHIWILHTAIETLLKKQKKLPPSSVLAFKRFIKTEENLFTLP